MSLFKKFMKHSVIGVVIGPLGSMYTVVATFFEAGKLNKERYEELERLRKENEELKELRKEDSNKPEIEPTKRESQTKKDEAQEEVAQESKLDKLIGVLTILIDRLKVTTDKKANDKLQTATRKPQIDPTVDLSAEISKVAMHDPTLQVISNKDSTTTDSKNPSQTPALASDITSETVHK